MAKAGMLDNVLRSIKVQLVITMGIYKECTLKKDAFDAKIIKARVKEGKIKILGIKDLNLYKKIKDEFSLGMGEAEAIVWCMENKKYLITDDRKAMNACKILDISFTTNLNILATMYRKGKIEESEASIFKENLKKFGRYSDKVIQDFEEDLKNGKNE